jgi:hypothetical protein
MFRPNLSNIVARNRWNKLSECTLSSGVKFKQTKKMKKTGGGPINKESPALIEITNLTDKKRSVAKADVDIFLKAHPLPSLNAVEMSSLVRSLGKTKYSYDPSQLTQLVTALGSVEMKLNAQCLGKTRKTVLDMTVLQRHTTPCNIRMLDGTMYNIHLLVYGMQGTSFTA